MRIVRNRAGGRCRPVLWLAALACVALGSGCSRTTPQPNDAPPVETMARFFAAPRPLGPSTGWTAIVAEYRHSCGLRRDGSLWCWGSNASAQLGDGTTTRRDTPTRVGRDGDWRSVRLGDHFTCATQADQSLWCWGSHLGTTPGSGSFVANSTPRRYALHAAGPGARWLSVDPPLRFEDFGIGDTHLCGLRAEGAVFCWGRGDRVGDGSPDRADTPRQVDLSGLPTDGFRALSLGSHHSCALGDDARPYCWGKDDRNQMGDGGPRTHAPKPVPVALPSPVRLEVLACGTFHSCGIDREGAAWCWGDNHDGQLGAGDTTERAEPVRVDTSHLPSPVRFTRLEAGYAHTCGLDAAGVAYCWGRNRNGELGIGRDGEAEPRPLSVQAPADVTGWRTLSVGAGYTCAITLAGRAFCWGLDEERKLGLGGAASDPGAASGKARR